MLHRVLLGYQAVFADPDRQGSIRLSLMKRGLSFGRGASKSTTQGGIFDLNMYITFDCAEIAAF